jgi:hypothetical protein
MECAALKTQKYFTKIRLNVVKRLKIPNEEKLAILRSRYL